MYTFERSLLAFSGYFCYKEIEEILATQVIPSSKIQRISGEYGEQFIHAEVGNVRAILLIITNTIDTDRKSVV